MGFEVNESREHFANRKLGTVWALPIDAIDPTAADDNFAYLKNTGKVPIEIVDVQAASTVAGIVKMERCTGTVTGGATAVPVQMNGLSNKIPEAVFETGVDITGLTDVGIVGVVGLGAGQTPNMRFPTGCILGLNEAVLLNWSAATGIITGTILVMEVPEKDD